MKLPYDSDTVDLGDTMAEVDGNPEDRHARVHLREASHRAVTDVFVADPDIEWGMTRSQWYWVRFPNGDLMLGCFPQDELYSEHEQEHS